MMRLQRNICLFAAAVLLAAGVHAAEMLEQRSFTNENVGAVTLAAPKDWKGIQRAHINFGTTFYRLVPPKEGPFDFEILVNDLKHMKMDALVDKDLELYIKSNMAQAAPQSREGTAKATRFGKAGNAVYARLTDKAPKPGEFHYFTQGVKLQGQKVVLFTLMSNDIDGAVLKQALQIVDSVQFKD